MVRRRQLIGLAFASGVMLAGACGKRGAQVGAHDPDVGAHDPVVSKSTPHAAPLLKNDSPFAPSFTRLRDADGKLDTFTLADPVRCSGCHADVVAQWDPSAHHNSSFGNRFYAASVSLTREHRGNKTSRWCAGCHDPTLLLDKTIDRDEVSKSPRANDGVACLVCHSITEGSRTGGGGYLLDYRAFAEPDVKNVKSVAEHKAAMKTTVMSDGEFCASCHKVSLHADVNGKRWYRGQNDFDGWEQGPYALGGAKTAGFIYAPDVEAQSCQGCHMPKETATKGDLAAKMNPAAGPSGEKSVRSHRFLAANTAIAAFAHDADTISRQAKALAGAVRVDVIAVRNLGSKTASAIAPGDRFALDVVVENTRVGHRFPTGTADSNEIWLDLEVRDAAGKVVARSGALDPKTLALDPEAHRFGVLQLDDDGKPALLRDAHRFAAIGWDNTIGPRDARVMHYRATVPSGATLPLSVTAKVLYRKFTAAYSLEACKTTASSAPSPALPGVPCPPLPVVEVARDDLTIGVIDATAEASKPPRWKRLDAYARALLNTLQEDVGDATPVLAEVLTLAPERAEGHIDLARLLIRQGRTAEALSQLDAAAKIDALTPVIPFLRGIAHYEIYKLGEAVEPLRLSFARAPKSVQTAELLAEALELAGDDRGAIDVSQAGLIIDPESAQLHHLEALAFDRLGLTQDADVAREGYLTYRRDDDTPRLRNLCKKIVPGCALESNPSHVHELAPR